MNFLFEYKSQTIFVSASTVNDNGKKRKIVIESRPTFAIVKPQGSRKCFPIAWEVIYEAAVAAPRRKPATGSRGREGAQSPEEETHRLTCRERIQTSIQNQDELAFTLPFMR